MCPTSSLECDRLIFCSPCPCVSFYWCARWQVLKSALLVSTVSLRTSSFLVLLKSRVWGFSLRLQASLCWLTSCYPNWRLVDTKSSSSLRWCVAWISWKTTFATAGMHDCVSGIFWISDTCFMWRWAFKSRHSELGIWPREGVNLDGRDTFFSSAEFHIFLVTSLCWSPVDWEWGYLVHVAPLLLVKFPSMFVGK